MTCIIGLIDKGNVYIGGDSAAVSDEESISRTIANPKVFKTGDFLIGYTSSYGPMCHRRN